MTAAATLSRERKNPSAQSSCALRRSFRGATQLDPPGGKPSLSSRTPDTCRPGNGCVPRRFLLIAFRSALRSPFTSSARTAVPLSAAPCTVPRGRYYSPSLVYMKDTFRMSFCQEHRLYFRCTPDYFTYSIALSAEIRPKMTMSATAFPPRRLPPWTPPQTSPAANSPGMAFPSLLMTSAAVLIFTPPIV